MVEKARIEYLNNTVGNSLATDGKKFWSYVKFKRKETLGIPTLKTSSGVNDTSHSKANALNAQFSSVFTSDTDLPVPDKGPSPYLDIGELMIEKEGVTKQLRQLKPNKANGPDDIPARMLQEYGDDLAPMLTNIMQ